MGFLGFGDNEQTTTTMLDPRSRAFVERYLRPAGRNAFNFAQNAMQPFTLGPGRLQRLARSELLMQGPGNRRLDEFLSGAMGGAAENFGFATQGFDPSRIQDFMDPFTGQVIDAQRGEFARQRDLASRETSQQAARSRAFGSRRDLLEGTRLGEIDRAEANQIAQLRSQGFAGAQNAALSDFARQTGLAAQIGGQQFGSILPGLQFGQQSFAQRIGQLGGLGEQFRALQERQAREGLLRHQAGLGFLQQGLGPTGTVTTTEAGSSPLGSALGGALTGFGIGGPFGAAVGGRLGFLGSFF